MIIDETLRKSVAFACYRDKDGKIRYGGTVFFVSDDLDEQLKKSFIVTVTAQHVIEGIKKDSQDQKVLIGLNLRDGGTDFEETKVEDWESHLDLPDRLRMTDVAVLAWCPPPKFD